jgi:hypothetical protein
VTDKTPGAVLDATLSRLVRIPAWFSLCLALAVGAGLGRVSAPTPPPPAQVLGAFEDVTIDDADMPFHALVDTGAAFSSVNAHEIHVLDRAKDPTDNIGKQVEYLLVNDKGRQAKMRSRVEKVKLIGNADHREYRYHVYLTVAHNGIKQRILVNLNDRSKSVEKLLLGRNFLPKGVVVDVHRNPE